VHLDAAQLVKHALGLRSTVRRSSPVNSRCTGASRYVQGKEPVLCYLFAEPPFRHAGTAIPKAWQSAHRDEIEKFAEMVSGDEVTFHAFCYQDLLASWKASPLARIRDHASAVEARFGPL
jgi:hypothetical protein